MKLFVLLLSAIAVVSCNRDPNVAKRRYLENGNRYYDRGKFKEASIMYRQSLQKDLKFGPAHYRLALTEMKLGRLTNAVGALRRAVELLPPGSAEHTDATVKLAEIFLAVAPQEQFLKESADMVEGILKRDPNSYDGHRLHGDLSFVRARAAAQVQRADEARKQVLQAIASYRKADSIKKDQPGLLLALGRALTANNQMQEAEALYRRVLQLDKTNPSAYSELYQLYAYQNRLPEAEQILKQGFDANPKQYSFLTMLARHYYVQNRRDEMVKVLERLKSYHKDFPQNSSGAYITAGDFYLRLNDPEGALAQYREGLKVDSGRTAAYQKRMIEVLMRQGKRAEAAALNEEILKKNPKDTDARGLSASLLLEKGDVQKALQDLQSIVTAAPENVVARFNLGRAHLAKGEVEQARQHFAEAIRLRPDYIPPRLALTQLEVMRREYANALKSAEEIIRYDRNNLPARLLQAAALMGQQKFTDARNLLEALHKAQPNSADILFQLGLVHLAEKRFQDAENVFRKAYDMNPGNTRGLMGVIETHLAQGKPDQAIQVLQAESAKYPDRSDLYILLGNAAVRTGKFDYGIEQFNKVLAKADPKSRQAGDLYLRIGETYRRKGDLNQSVAALQKASELIPEDRMIVGNLALALDGAGRRDEARRAYEHVLKLDPNNGIALNNLAYLMAESGGDLDQALTYAQRAKQRLPDLHEVSDTLGWIYLKKNLSDSAIEIFRDLVAKAPKHSTYRYHLAMALSQKGDKANALKELNEALKSSPPQEEAAKIKELIAKLG